ncbi:MAG: hypothetical protein WC819_05060 [Parcubacteria group bacterium]|jgi:hypothetical protein
MRRIFGYAIGTFLGYVFVLVTMASVWGTTMLIAYSANASGNLALVGKMFIGSIATVVFVQWSPIVLALTALIGYIYSMLPGIGSQNAREDIAKVQSIAKNIWIYVLIAFAMPLLVMSLFQFHTKNNTTIIVTFTVATIACIIWNIAMQKPRKAIWQAFLWLGIYGFIKCLVFAYPVEMYDVFGFFPGANIYTEKIERQRNTLENTLKSRHESDVDIETKDDAETAEAFTNLCKLRGETSDEVFANKETLCKKSEMACKIITKEAERQKKGIINSTLKKAGEIKNAIGKKFVDEPEPVWTPVGEMKYTPNNPDWTTVSITVPEGEGLCRIKCVRGYYQYFTDKGSTSYIEPGGRSYAQKLALEDSRYTPLAQLIKVNGVTNSVRTHEFSCGGKVVKASFKPNMHSTIPEDFSKNEGDAIFLVEKQIFPPNK